MSQNPVVNLDNASVQRILRAATTCFGRLGYHGASMQAIAGEAAVSKSLVHYHFESKEHLFVEMQLQLLRELLGRVHELMDHSRGGLANMNAALDAVMTWVEDHVEHLRVLMELHSMAAERPKIAARLTQFDDAVSGLIVDGLQNALGPALDRLIIPPERVVRLIRTVFNGLILELCYSADDATRDRIRETYRDAKTIFASAVMRELS